MTPHLASIRKAIEAYVGIIETAGPAENQRLEALPAILDRLAVSVHEAECTFDAEADYPDAPNLEHSSVRFLIQTHFPRLSHYNLADPMTRSIGEGSIIVGDAIDDLADIYKELKETLWRWERTSQDDALWHFTWAYRTHWGLHLRSLQYYLHVPASGVDENG